MKRDFDKVIDRRNTNSEKYDFAAERGYPADVLPLWVADMDFRAPEPVLEVLQKMVNHGIFGYSAPRADYFKAVSAWFRTRFGWETERAWMLQTPGVVFAIATAVRALTEPGDAVVIQPPVYYPFAKVVRRNDRRVVENPLRFDGARYTMDFDGLEALLRTQRPRLLLLCSPHNPVCRVWSREELARLGGLCRQYGVCVVSDEIHCDFTLPGHPHTMLPLACPELTDRMIVCTAPSKTFNLAGLQASNIFIPDDGLRRRFAHALYATGFDGLNGPALAACQAAYARGGPWLDDCRAYLRENLAALRTFLNTRLPELKLVEPEGTYFAWLDCRGLGLEPDALDALVVQKARLWLDDGQIFGAGGAGFQRVVLACPRATLMQALERLERAIHGGA